MKLNLQVSFNDGTTKDIEAGTADMVAFEDKYDVSVATLGAGWSSRTCLRTPPASREVFFLG